MKAEQGRGAEWGAGRELLESTLRAIRKQYLLIAPDTSPTTSDPPPRPLQAL